jgi:hypothetical protein
MRSLGTTARSIGVLYLLFMVPGLPFLLYVPRLIVSGNATATAANLAANELAYRLSILGWVVGHVLWIYLVLSLYALFEAVDRKQARLMVTFVAVSVAMTLVNLTNQLAPLILLSGADFLSPLSRPQLEALAYAFLRLHSTGTGIEFAFWGLWLLPFGILVIRSGFAPKLIGYLLILGCVGWLIQSAVAIVVPAYSGMAFKAMQPLVAPGELSMMLWLLIKGGNVPLRQPQPVVT